MRRLVLLVALGFATGLFVVGQALGAGQMDRIQTAQMGASGENGQAQWHSAAVQLDREQVRYMQNILQANGYDVGNESGQIGPNTTSALQQFQQDQGLAVTGIPDEETLKALAPSPEEQQYFGLAPAFGEGPSSAEPMQHEKLPTPQGNGGSGH